MHINAIRCLCPSELSLADEGHSVSLNRLLKLAELTQVVIQIIDGSLLVWLGSMYAPLLPFFGLAANIVQFYTKNLLSLYLYTPPKERYSASRTNVIVYCLMLGAPLLHLDTALLHSDIIVTANQSFNAQYISMTGFSWISVT